MTISSTKRGHIQRIPLKAGAKKVLEAFWEDGVVIIEGFLSPEQVQSLNSEADPYVARLRQRDSQGDEGVFNSSLAKLLPSPQKRVHNLAGKSPTFRNEVLNHPLMHELAKQIFEPLGDYWVVSGVILDNAPGTPAQDWHHDQRISPVFNNSGDAPDTFINFFTAMTDFTAETGATEYLWHSHRMEGITGPSDDHPRMIAEMKAGDTCLLSGKIMHRGGANDSEQTTRRAFSLVLQPSLFTPYESNLNLPRELVESLTPLAQKMIGWRTMEPTAPFSIGLWTVDMDDVSRVMGLKSNQPLQK
ncbi:Verruculogen synthase [Penicillium ucsense]|uniref:Verruculogen synthase n=1 Tax=Penicillium ucsense TaxID=2839758 RepID=A0A8J8W2H2_9EURO|nr:Verruculogen synthase [Penicillium ucsense]KAF7733916.1 Verruculogen synthase [Penicillium ucsense]